MRLTEYCGSNARCLEMNGLKLYFSYETLIAFYHVETGLVVRENDWGPTTGKHLNAIESDKRFRIPGDAFERQWGKLAESLGIDKKITA